MKESSSAAVPLIPDPLSPVPFGTATGLLKTFRQAGGVSTSNCSCIAIFVMLSALISRQNCYCHRFAGGSLYGSESKKPRTLFGRVECKFDNYIPKFTHIEISTKAMQRYYGRLVLLGYRASMLFNLQSLALLEVQAYAPDEGGADKHDD